MKLVPKGAYGPSDSPVTASASDPVVDDVASSSSSSVVTRHRNRHRKNNRSRGGSPIASHLSAQDSQSSVGSVGSSPLMPSTAAPTQQSSSTTKQQDISGMSELEINETTSAPSSQPDLIIASCNANANANSSCSIEPENPDSVLSRRDSDMSSSTVANRSYECRSPTPPELSQQSTCTELTQQSFTSGYVSSTYTSNPNAQSSSYASPLSKASQAASASTAASKTSPNSASAQTRLQQKPSPISGHQSWKPSADWRSRAPRGRGWAGWSPSASAQRPGSSPRWQGAYAAPRPAPSPAPSPRSRAHFPTITDGSYPNPR